MNTVIIGCDPGQTGAICALGQLFPEVVDLGVIGKRIDGVWLAAWCARVGGNTPAVAYIERAGAMPKQGVASTFRIGENYGILLGVLMSMKIPYVEVSPASWKKAMKLGKDKSASRAEACRMFPELHEDLRRKKDHNRAEALLIAEYGRREQVRFNGNPDAEAF